MEQLHQAIPGWWPPVTIMEQWDWPRAKIPTMRIKLEKLTGERSRLLLRENLFTSLTSVDNRWFWQQSGLKWKRPQWSSSRWIQPVKYSTTRSWRSHIFIWWKNLSDPPSFIYVWSSLQRHRNLPTSPWYQSSWCFLDFLNCVLESLIKYLNS